MLGVGSWTVNVMKEFQNLVLRVFERGWPVQASLI